MAAGSGTRLAAGRPKAFVEVGGETILARSLRPILLSSTPWQIVVVVPTELVDEAASLVPSRAAGFVSVVAGGSTRQESVAAGLAAVAPSVETVLVHDSARCFTPTTQFELVAETVEALGHGVVPGLPVSDTIKRVDAAGSVTATVDRSELVAMQTPQGFPRRALDDAYAGATEEHTDDAALFALAGHEVTVVPGASEAFKITTPWDLARAEMLAGDGRVPAVQLRTGVGIDVHAFDAEQPLRLGTLDWPGEAGLAGHSDGDAVAHALVDALLSAAGLGDIGSRFGTSDPRYAGASGEVFLTATRAILDEAGTRLVNAAVQVVGNRPRLAARRSAMEEALTILLGAPVSVSATTTDGLGFTGRGEGVTVIATALVEVQAS